MDIFLFAFTFYPYRSDEIGAGTAAYFPSGKKIKQKVAENTFCFKLQGLARKLVLYIPSLDRVVYISLYNILGQ